MKIYKIKAFTYLYKINNGNCVGNPASVILYEDNSLSKKRKRQIAIKEKQPVTVFLKKRINNNEFDVEFFNPDGSEICICGHGTIAASYLLNKLFSLDNIKYYFNYNLSIKPLKEWHIKAFIENGLISVKLPSIPICKTFINKTLDKILNTLEIGFQNIEVIYKCEELRDYVFVLNNVELLRKIKPDFKKMITPCQKLKLRCVFVTAKSNINGFDYETRSFIPHSGINEDVVCGSSNCSIAQIWKNKLNKNNLKCLFPYKFYENRLGGVQEINFIDSNFFYLSGYAGE